MILSSVPLHHPHYHHSICIFMISQWNFCYSPTGFVLLQSLQAASRVIFLTCKTGLLYSSFLLQGLKPNFLIFQLQAFVMLLLPGSVNLLQQPCAILGAPPTLAIAVMSQLPDCSILFHVSGLLFILSHLSRTPFSSLSA